MAAKAEQTQMAGRHAHAGMCLVKKRQAGKAGQPLTEINVQRSQVKAKGNEDARQHWPQMWEEGEHHKAQNVEGTSRASALEQGGHPLETPTAVDRWGGRGGESVLCHTFPTHHSSLAFSESLPSLGN